MPTARHAGKLMDHLKNLCSPHVFAELVGATGLAALAKRLADSGLTWESAAALIGACGTLLLGLGSVTREVRAMRAARAAETSRETAS